MIAKYTVFSNNYIKFLKFIIYKYTYQMLSTMNMIHHVKWSCAWTARVVQWN